MARELILRGLTPSELQVQPIYLVGDINVIGGNEEDPGSDGEWKGPFSSNNVALGFFACGDGPNQKSGCNGACIGPIAFATDSPIPLTGYASLNKTFVDNAVFNLWKEGDYLPPHFTSGGQPLGVGNLWMFETGFDNGGEFIWADGGNIDDADYGYVMNYGLSHDATPHGRLRARSACAHAGRG